jgi:hypothetical protein
MGFFSRAKEQSTSAPTVINTSPGWEIIFYRLITPIIEHFNDMTGILYCVGNFQNSLYYASNMVCNWPFTEAIHLRKVTPIP